MEQEEDQDAKRKIQFSVPSSVPSQLDPRQVEMIRRRRPTPATLFRLTDPPSPEEDGSSHQRVLRDSTALKTKLVHMSSYQPPSLKAVQRMALAHFASLDMKSVDGEDSSSGDEEQPVKEIQGTTPPTDKREENSWQSLKGNCGQEDNSLSHHNDKEEAQEMTQEQHE